MCECSSPYLGNFCESMDDSCNDKNCQNSAYCIEINGEAICECLDGFEGEFCERQIKIDFCANSPCGNATCVNRDDYYECVCDAGIGKRCHLQPCDYKPCPEHSVCENVRSMNATKDNYV